MPRTDPRGPQVRGRILSVRLSPEEVVTLTQLCRRIGVSRLSTGVRQLALHAGTPRDTTRGVTGGAKTDARAGLSEVAAIALTGQARQILQEARAAGAEGPKEAVQLALARADALLAEQAALLLSGSKT